MKIVRPTHPPRMAVQVDTILEGVKNLAIAPAHPSFNRIDVICVVRGGITVVTGKEAYHPLQPKIGGRVIATIYIPHGISGIMHHHITEVI